MRVAGGPSQAASTWGRISLANRSAVSSSNGAASLPERSISALMSGQITRQTRSVGRPYDSIRPSWEAMLAES